MHHMIYKLMKLPLRKIIIMIYKLKVNDGFFVISALDEENVYSLIQSAWERLNLRADYLKKLSDSMPDRLKAVIEAGGQWTRY